MPVAFPNLVLRIFPGAEPFEIPVKLKHKVDFEILRNEAAIVYITDDLPFFGKNGHLAVFDIAVEHEVSLLPCRETEPHVGTPFHGADLGTDTVFKPYAVMMRFGNFIVMPECQGTCFLVDDEIADARHQGKNGVIVHPRAALMNLLKAPDGLRFILILPSVTVLSGLRRKIVHAKGQSHRGVGISVGECPLRIRSLEGIYILHEVTLLCMRRTGSLCGGENYG